MFSSESGVGLPIFEPMKLRALLFTLLPILFACQGPEEHEDWIQLFNGQDLSGWDVKIAGYELNDNFNNTFRVEDGFLKVSYDEYETFDEELGHLFYHRSFSHYILRAEYRFAGEQVPGGPGWAFPED